MGLGDIVSDVGGGIVRGAGEVVEGAGRVVREVAGVFDVGEPSGDDHGSSNWAAWGHNEIRTMLDNTVDEGDIQEAAQAWRVQRDKDVEIITSLTRDLNGIISTGWGGLSGEKAIGALDPVNTWSATFGEAAQRTGDLMEHSGSSAGQAKTAVPPAVDHDLRRSLTSFAVGGAPGAFVDAIAQDHAQEEARREAVRIMNNVYSAPINENRVAVPHYPEPVDPTLQTPEPSPVSGPPPGAGLSRGGSGIPGGGGGVPGGGVPGGGAPYQPPAVAELQGAGSVDGGQFGPSAGQSQIGGQGYGGAGYPGHGGQGPGAAAAAVPFMPPMAGGGEQERARRGFRGAGPPGAGSPGGRAGGGGGYPGGGRGGVGGYPGGGGDFGPRGSSPGAAAATGEGRAGAGGAAGGRGGGGALGGVPVGGAGGRGQGGEDTEHQRPSYLIEMDDIFNDGRKVAPPVIGVDPPE